MSAASILVVDDESDIRSTISDILADEGYSVRVAADATEAREEVRRQRPDLILLDVWMPDTDGITLLKEWKQQGAPRCPVVILSGHGTVETAVEATRLGAVDFVEKPLSLAKLLLTVQRALSRTGTTPRPGGGGLLGGSISPAGRSAAMTALRERAAALAPRPEPLLILGESGTGRSVLARYIHGRTDTGERPFVARAAAAIPDENAAQLLLGAETAVGPEPGLLEQAAGGTLYLSDVQQLGPTGQKLLAGILGQKSWAPLGRAAEMPLTARLITSAQPDGLETLLPDLLNRLNVLELRVPPLRDRADDVPDLLRATVERLVDAEHLTFRRFSLAAQNRLRNYPWPGNVRELETLVRRLLVVGGREEIGLSEVEQALTPTVAPAQPLVKQDLLGLPLREAREQFERAYLTEQLALCGGRVGALAKRVGMERTHLYRKLRSLGVDFRQMAEDE
jgi:two-component system nitrogen regulation response regulator NtrX